MPGQWGEVANVAGQEGDRVLLAVPMNGFPPGFKLRPGERVFLVGDESGLAVRPFIREVKVNSLSTEAAGVLVADNERFVVQEGTLRLGEGHRGPFIVSVVDRGSAPGPEQVIAIRPAE